MGETTIEVFYICIIMMMEIKITILMVNNKKIPNSPSNNNKKNKIKIKQQHKNYNINNINNQDNSKIQVKKNIQRNIQNRRVIQNYPEVNYVERQVTKES